MEGNSLTFGVTQLQEILNSLTSVIGVTEIIGFLSAIIGVAAVFALMWFGVRKGLSMVMGAIRKGRIGA